MSFFPVLGMKISCLESYEETYALTLKYLKEHNEPWYITVNNVNAVTIGIKDRKFQEIINNSYLSLPDGRPLSITAKIKGIKGVNRIFGPSFFETALEAGQRDDLRHFLFGSSEITLRKMKEVISIIYPDAKIAGMISPPYREFSTEENKQYLEEINSTSPDLVWVSLGAPRQEKWIFENYRQLNKGLMIGIGAGFDYLAGNIKHAPNWMKNLSLEWFYRFLQEPVRLWKRYLFSNTIFVFYSILELTGIRKFD
jgi:N-acetylglucosaminyldiphosphoundecaprenol N-acetyl-beta-D-mannosaminyltransferase